MSDCIHYTPGTPEFDEIAKTITHVSRVPFSKQERLIRVEIDPASGKSRRETLDELR
jgi:hypothetical protein